MCFGHRKSQEPEYWIVLPAILFTQSQLDWESMEVRQKEMPVFALVWKVPCFQRNYFNRPGRKYLNSQSRPWFFANFAFSDLWKTAFCDRVRYRFAFSVVFKALWGREWKQNRFRHHSFSGAIIFGPFAEIVSYAPKLFIYKTNSVPVGFSEVMGLPDR